MFRKTRSQSKLHEIEEEEKIEKVNKNFRKTRSKSQTFDIKEK